MTELADQSQDDEVKKGIRKLRALLKDPAKFGKWAKVALDMSRLRKR